MPCRAKSSWPQWRTASGGVWWWWLATRGRESLMCGAPSREATRHRAAWGLAWQVSGDSWMSRLTPARDRKSTRLNSSHSQISYAVFCLKKKKKTHEADTDHENITT